MQRPWRSLRSLSVVVVVVVLFPTFSLLYGSVGNERQTDDVQHLMQSPARGSHKILSQSLLIQKKTLEVLSLLRPIVH